MSLDTTFPFIIPEDLSSPPLFTAAQRIEGNAARNSDLAIPPLDGAILIHQSGIMPSLKRNHRLRKLRAFPKELYLLRKKDGIIGVLTNFGVGAPAAAVAIEELAVLGIRKLIAIGIAGGLQESTQSGDIAICERAIREEGTSHHYLLPSRYAFPSHGLNQDLATALDSRRCSYTSGASWTTDAPYRESRRKAMIYRQDGVITVEMEAAAVFAVCSHLKVECGVAFIVADTFPGWVWQPGFDRKKMTAGLVTLFEASVQVLEK